MSTPRDDDALSWGGDDDPTLDVGDTRASAPAAGPDPLVPEARRERPARGASDPASPGSDAGEPDPHAEAASSASGSSASGSSASVASAPHEAPDPAASAPLGNVGLVGIGMVAATFLLFAIGWLVAGLRLNGLGLPIPSVTVIALTIGAALAPVVWFVAVLVLTRGWRTWQRFLLLIVGIVLLVPWPFLSLGAFA